MSEPDVPRLQQIRKHSVAKGVHQACEVCGSSKGWTVPFQNEEEGHVMQIGLLINSGAAVDLASVKVVNTTPMICKHCGNIRLFLNDYLMSDKSHE